MINTLVLHSKEAVNNLLQHTAIMSSFLATPSLRLNSSTLLPSDCHRSCPWDKLTVELQVKILRLSGACSHQSRLVSRSIQQHLDREVTSLRNSTYMICCTPTQQGVPCSLKPITHFSKVQIVRLEFENSTVLPITSLQQLSHMTCLQKLELIWDYLDVPWYHAMLQD